MGKISAGVDVGCVVKEKRSPEGKSRRREEKGEGARGKRGTRRRSETIAGRVDGEAITVSATSCGQRRGDELKSKLTRREQRGKDESSA